MAPYGDLAAVEKLLQAHPKEFAAVMLEPAGATEPAPGYLEGLKELVHRHGSLLVFDGYRPWRITKQMWDHTPAEKKEFVADPRKGSRHNRGCAVDLGLYDLKSGKPVEVVSGYDEFSDRAFADYSGGTSRQRCTATC